MDDLTKVREEWVVFRYKNDGGLDCEPKPSWYEFAKDRPHLVEHLELIADGLTEEQAETMVQLSREWGMTEEWIVYRFKPDGSVYCQPKSGWDRWVKDYSATERDFELIATGLTKEQADAMVKLSGSGE